MTLYVIGMVAIVVIVLIMSLVLITKAYSYEHKVDPTPINEWNRESNKNSNEIL
ncbi:YtzI protein [Cerasibacillus terrae]|uniref:YtzI protein n=1 Tax=Cerasibacillus terrae TaxID=2498845 RepID=A0A5C8NKD3_9BACI|nr:YtzI protein [Cerasibacillus terrae]TXL61738.1 YtzI protein [Cerasibacillus terrae]